MEGINFDVKQFPVAVEELVGGEAMDVQVTLDSILLRAGQVVVGHVGTADVIFLDDVLPCCLRTAVG